MGSFDLNFVKNDIYYDDLKHVNLILSGKKIETVSFYLNRDIGKELLDIINTSADTISEREDKILKFDTLKHEILKELVDIRLRYKKLYYRVKSGKELTDSELVELDFLKGLKCDFVSSINFLDAVLQKENNMLKNTLRKQNRYNNVDLKSSFFLDADSRFIYDMMVDGEKFYETNSHIYLCALSYYLKTIDVSSLDKDKLNTCISYVDQIIKRVSENKVDYLENKEGLYLLKQVVQQRLLSTSKKDKFSKSFFNKIEEKIKVLEARNVFYDEVSDDFEDLQLCSSFYKVINDEKNINVVETFLRKRPDLIYMLSPGNSTQYYLHDVLLKYGNLLLNARENHVDFEYYRSLVKLYTDVICTLGDQDMRLLFLKKLQVIIKNVNNSGFSARRKEACLFEISECVDKLNGVDTSILLDFHDDTLVSYHPMNDDSVFSLDADGTKIFEQAYSYREDGGKKYLTFYIPDTTELYGFRKNPKLEDLIITNSEKSMILPREMCNALSLKKMMNRSVIAYRFVIGEDYQVEDLDIKKEKVKVSNNFYFTDIDFLINENSDNYYSNTIKKMYNTLKKIDSSDCIVSEEKFGKYFTTKLSLFFQNALGKYCDDNDIPYISRFVYTKKQADMGIVSDIEENLNSDNLTVAQIMKSVENAYLAGVYTVDKNESMSSERRAKVSSPLRQLASYVNQMVIYHYFVDGDNITYKDDLKNRRDLHKVADALNQKLIQNEMEVIHNDEKTLQSKIKQVNRKINYRIMKANEN